MKSNFFFAMPLKHLNSKYQSKEPIYILLVLAIKAILLVFLKHVSPVLEEKKRDAEKRRKIVRDAGFSGKRRRKSGSDPDV